MYTAHFGFREKPFRLVPNPEYLFLSESHREALAQLHYALAQGEGFVEITGEVGTGKTTLCRAFLEGLDETTCAAYIFNPRLGPRQLLRALCDEFGIAAEAADTKGLVDALNRFLLEKKAEGKRVIVLIDEAQNLARNVLEQLRLLSNLETPREKLLQIVLVGQPELADLLDSPALRQVGQRIATRCRLLPLDRRQTGEYIRYRLNVAARRPLDLFTPAAIRRIHAWSGGIPRRINIACDRALLAAFGKNRRRVTGGLARRAIAELSPRAALRPPLLLQGRLAFAAFLLAALAAALFLYPEPLREAFAPRRTALPLQGVETPAAERPPEAAGAAAADRLRALEPRESRRQALAAALAAWGETFASRGFLDDVADDASWFNLSAKAAGFSLQRIEEADPQALRALDMPVVLEMRPPDDPAPRYLALTRIAGGRFFFAATGETPPLTIAEAELGRLWRGVAYLPWKNFLALTGTIPGSAPPDSILALKMLLRELGHDDVPLDREYDGATRRAVEEVQSRFGLPVDGVVGNLTKIALYRASDRFAVPRVLAGRTATQENS
ncbi:MAG: AAA family ATPase [Desulfobacterales bacterium]